MVTCRIIESPGTMSMFFKYLYWFHHSFRLHPLTVCLMFCAYIFFSAQNSCNVKTIKLNTRWNKYITDVFIYCNYNHLKISHKQYWSLCRRRHLHVVGWSNNYFCVNYDIRINQHIFRAETKSPTFYRQHLETHFLVWKLLCFDSDFTNFGPRSKIDN